MNKIFFLTIFVTLIFTAEICAAKDIWVDNWEGEGVDVYVMDDTIVANDANNFSVSTKMVHNGKLSRVLTWNFSKYGDDMWRYETDSMDGSHTTVVTPRNKIFEFCMKKLGWSYKIVDMWYY